MESGITNTPLHLTKGDLCVLQELTFSEGPEYEKNNNTISKDKKLCQLHMAHKQLLRSLDNLEKGSIKSIEKISFLAKRRLGLIEYAHEY